MPKVTIVPHQRLLEFPESGFQVYDNKLWCPFCHEFLNHMKKCVIKAHAVSRKHTRSRENYQQSCGDLLQHPSVSYVTCRVSGSSSTAAVTRRKEPKKGERNTPCLSVTPSERNVWRWASLVTSFVDAKIPLDVLEDERFLSWLNDNLKNKLPSPVGIPICEGASLLDIRNTVAECLCRDICIVLDDTMNTGESGLIALSVFASPLGESFRLRLVTTQFLETYDLDAVFQLTLSALEIARIDAKNVVILCSNNSEYLGQVGDRLKQFCPRLHCIPCWETILCSAINEIRSQCCVLDQLALAIDSALKADQSQRNKLLVKLRYQSRNGRAILFPCHLSSKRPFAWLRAVFFVCEHFDPLKEWILTMDETSFVAQRLRDLVSRVETRELLLKFRNSSLGLAKAMDDFERGDVLPSCVWSTMYDVAAILNRVGFSISELKNRMESVAPSSGFWRFIEILDPRRVTCHSSLPSNFVKELYWFATEPVPSDEMEHYGKTLTTINVEDAKTTSPVQFWKTCSDQMPSMARLALKVLSIPLTTAFIEKTFASRNSWDFNVSKREALATEMRLVFNSTHAAGHLTRHLKTE